MRFLFVILAIMISSGCKKKHTECSKVVEVGGCAKLPFSVGCKVKLENGQYKQVSQLAVAGEIVCY